MDQNTNFPPAPTMVEIAVADIRRAGESGLALLDRLACVDRLIADDPGARVLLLMRSSCLAPTVRRERDLATAGTALADDGEALLELAAIGGDRRPPGQPSLERVLWEHAQRTLARHRGNRKAASQALRISDNTLRRRLAARPVE